MFIRRIWAKKTVLLLKEALSVMGTMSRAGDVARMIARLLLNPAAFGETYTAATAEPLFPKSKICDRMDKYIEKHNL